MMIFNHPLVRAYLMEHGVVYTFRKNHKKTADGVRPQIGKDWATDKRCGKKIADIMVNPIEPIDGDNMRQVLAKYVRDSGFYTGERPIYFPVDAWARAIHELNPYKPTEAPEGWIYQVKLREAEG